MQCSKCQMAMLTKTWNILGRSVPGLHHDHHDHHHLSKPCRLVVPRDAIRSGPRFSGSINTLPDYTRYSNHIFPSTGALFPAPTSPDAVLCFAATLLPPPDQATHSPRGRGHDAFIHSQGSNSHPGCMRQNRSHVHPAEVLDYHVNRTNHSSTTRGPSQQTTTTTTTTATGP